VTARTDPAGLSGTFSIIKTPPKTDSRLLGFYALSHILRTTPGSLRHAPEFFKAQLASESPRPAGRKPAIAQDRDFWDNAMLRV
jgi:hypothetical protein